MKLKTSTDPMDEAYKMLEEQPASLLLDFAIEEAIDQVVYLLTLKQVMEDKNAQNQPRQH